MNLEREARLSREQEFYAKCSELLGIKHSYCIPVKRRNRWNNRNPGNGRYEGFGLIRYHNQECIIVSCKAGQKHFKSVDEVYKFLTNYMMDK